MTPQTFNPAQAYEAHLVPAMFRPWADELIRRAPISGGDRVLDVACGTGIIARSVAPLTGSSGTVDAVDNSEPMLEVARSLPAPDGAPIHWRQASADALPFADGSFDVVLCQQGMQFFPDRQAAAIGMRRVLVDGGRAVISVWRGLQHNAAFAALDAPLTRHLGQSTDAPFSLGSREELAALFENSGFEGVSVEAVTRPVRFPSAQTFVEMTVMSAAAVLPELRELDAAARTALIRAVELDAADDLTQWRDGEALAFPMEAHILTAST